MSLHGSPSLLLAALLFLAAASCGDEKAPSPSPQKSPASAPGAALPANSKLETMNDAYPSGKKMSERQELVTSDGQRMRHGPIRMWHENGVLRFEGQYELGQIQGLWKYYYESGHLEREAEYEQGLLNGNLKEWWDNGHDKRVGVYAVGKAEGLWRSWHENGQLREEGELMGGLREGAWKFYDPAGTLLGDSGMYKRNQKQP